MIATNSTNLRENMKHYLDRVVDDYDTLIVTRKDDRNVVILSEESYNNILENMFILGNRENHEWLMESKRQLEAGLGEEHELIEVADGEE